MHRNSCVNKVYFANRVRIVPRRTYLAVVNWFLLLTRFAGAVGIPFLFVEKTVLEFDCVAASTCFIGALVDLLVAVRLTFDLLNGRMRLGQFFNPSL
jgi:hypothetical protein